MVLFREPLVDMRYLPRNFTRIIVVSLYISDLPNRLLISEPRLYADDTRLTLADRDNYSIQAPVYRDLSNNNHWLIANKLTLTLKKIEFMFYFRLKLVQSKN